MPDIQSAPQSRERGKVRLPLDHHETESVAKRIHILLCTDALSDDERGHLIKKYSDLRKADCRLARRLFDNPLPATSMRPMFFDDNNRPLSGVFGQPDLLVMTGWVFRLRDYVERLERKYFGHADNDDI